MFGNKGLFAKGLGGLWGKN